MKKVFFLSFTLLAGLTMKAETANLNLQIDTLRLEQLNDVVINGVRAMSNEASVATEIARHELDKFSKTGRELPFLFSQTPGVIAWSENGTGTGTSYMRIRGAAGSRINVTLDGVPLNSPEDQCVFWVNMNSYASFLGSAQIQRGLGTSTLGDGAFGGTIALSSATPDSEPGLELTGSYGAYNTRHMGGKFSTGTILNNLIIDGAYNQTLTDGFMHGTKGNSGSYYGGLLWMPSDNVMLRYRNIGNFEMTGQAWSGATAGDDNKSLMDGTYGTKTGIKTYQDMYDKGLGQYNSLYEAIQYDDNGKFLIDDNGKYVAARYMMKDGTYWDRTTDNFWQDHNILSLSWTQNEQLTTSITLHYTYGYGYYNEFRPNNKLEKYGLSFTDGQGNEVKKSDFVRKKGLEQHTYGAIWNNNISLGDLNIRAGLSMQQFKGNHFGHITYVGNDELEAAILADGKYTYYDSDAKKTDNSTFVKAIYNLTPQISLSADYQSRHVKYTTDGYNDKYIKDDDGIHKHMLDIDKEYMFDNFKFGVNWQKNGHNVYALAAYGNREPERNNFTDNGKYPAPDPESMLDIEAGYNYTSDSWYAGFNLYRMNYDNQFVQTGEQSDIGENLTVNIKDSYRMGIEMQAGVMPFKWLSIEGNAALSQNRIKDFTEVVEDWDNGSAKIHYDNSTLAFSPSAILNGFVKFSMGRFNAVWHTNYVSRQYLDNTENADRSLPAYSFSDLSATFTQPTKGIIRSIEIGANLNNIFNSHKATSGWVYSAIYESNGHPNDNRYYQIGFIPMSGFSAMGSITLKF